MKNIALFIFIASISYQLAAQDTIIKTSKDTIIAKIMEISPKEIKYKRFDNADGPTYIELKSNIVKIKYANGVTETFAETKTEETTKVSSNDYYNGTPLNNDIEAWGSRYRYQNKYMSEREMQEMLLNTKDKKIMKMVGQAKDAKNLQFIGFAGIPLGITSIAFLWKSTGIFSSNYNYTGGRIFNQEDLAVSAVCGVAAIACPVISIVAKSNRQKYNRQAVKMYNEKF